MEYAKIPNLSQKVSRIGLGTWAIGGWLWGGTEEKDAISTIEQALERGINLIDTAPVYGFGVAEEIVGKALKSFGKRDKVVISTKAGLAWDRGKSIYRDASKKRIYQEIEDSLTRVGVDYIDLYHVHWPDFQVPFEETAEAMDTLLKQGKIRSIGVSNFSVEMMQDFMGTSEIHVLQSPYNIFESQLDLEELPFCKKKKIALLGYGVLCRGLLSGKLKQSSAFERDDLRKIDPKFQKPLFSEYLACVEKLKSWALYKYNRPLAAIAARYALDKGIDVPLWGARHPRQLESIDEIWGWKLTEEDLAEIATIVVETISHPVGPEFMEPPKKQKVKMS